jgi:hypothetical protein
LIHCQLTPPKYEIIAFRWTNVACFIHVKPETVTVSRNYKWQTNRNWWSFRFWINLLIYVRPLIQ